MSVEKWEWWSRLVVQGAELERQAEMLAADEVWSLRARVAELERELETSRALATTNAHTHHEVRHLYAEMNRQGARLAAWEPVVRAAVKWWNEQSRRSHSALTDAVVAIRPEHRPEVEP